MVEHTPSEQADFTPNRVQREIMRIQRLFVPSQGDKEDILSYARRIVGIERERDEALTNGNDRIAELNTEAETTSARIAALEGALKDAQEALCWYDGLKFEPDDRDGETIGQIIDAALASSDSMKGE